MEHGSPVEPFIMPIAFRKSLKFILSCSFILLIVATPIWGQVLDARIALETPDKTYPLRGTWKFYPTDNLNFAKPDFPDKDWRPIRVPGQWNMLGLRNLTTAWYRMTFTVGPNLKGHKLAIGVPVIAEAHQMYVNGKLIGQRGEISSDGVLIRKNNSTAFYEIDSHLLSFDQPNVIALRVSDDAGWGGVVLGNFYIGTVNQTQQSYLRQLSWHMGGGLVAIFIGLTHFFYFFARRKERYYLYSALLATFAGLTILGSHRLFYLVWNNFLLNHFFFQIGMNVIGLLFSGFFHEYFVLRRTWWIRFFEWCYIPVILIFFISLFDHRIYRFYANVSYSIALLLFVIFTFISSYLSILGIRKRIDGSKIIALGQLIGMLCACRDILGYFQLLPPSRWATEGILIFSVSIAIAAAVRYSKVYRQAEDLSKKLIEAIQSEQALQAAKKHTDEILMSVNLGILTIDRDGRINGEYSRKIVDLFGRKDLNGIKFSALFQEEFGERIDSYIFELLNNRYMSEHMFADANPLKEYVYRTNINGAVTQRTLQFSFSRILDIPAKQVERIMVTIADPSGSALEQKIGYQQERARDVEKIYQILRFDTSIFASFIEEATKILDQTTAGLLSLNPSGKGNDRTIKQMLRGMHTIKGNAHSLNLTTMATIAHRVEEHLLEMLEGHDYSREKLSNAENTVLILRAELSDGNDIFKKVLGMRGALNTIPKTSLQQLEGLLRGMVDREAEDNNRAVDLIFEAPNDLSPLPNFLHRIRTPLIHVIRNAIDHGLESPEERENSGKRGKSRILVKLNRVGGFLEIVCEDDGKGLNKEKIVSKLISQGILNSSNLESISDSEVYSMIFLSGISTSDALSEKAGRGVGLNAVQEEIKSMGGKIDVESVPGLYTRFTFVFRENLSLMDEAS